MNNMIVKSNLKTYQKLNILFENYYVNNNLEEEMLISKYVD